MDISTHSQSMTDREYFAVIDTETTWQDDVMSIGVVIAHKNTYHIAVEKYYVITPECKQPAMYGYALNDYTPFTKCNRSKAISDLRSLLQNYCIEDIFAYNAHFDYNHLPELKDFIWRDIMRIAAYKQFNPSIPDDAECCSTGRLKSNYGVESMMQLLMGNERYFERHNAAFDAKDELLIMQTLGYPMEQYPSIQEISLMKARMHTRLERREQRKNDLQKHLIYGNIDLISSEATNKPVMIKCRICGHLWDVSYYTANTSTPKCPHCFPTANPKPKTPKEKLSLEEQLQTRAKDYADLIWAKSGGTLKVIEYRGSSKKATVICMTCDYRWEIRADHLKTRCYCPCCKKKDKATII